MRPDCQSLSLSLVQNLQAQSRLSVESLAGRWVGRDPLRSKFSLVVASVILPSGAGEDVNDRFQTLSTSRSVVRELVSWYRYIVRVRQKVVYQ